MAKRRHQARKIALQVLYGLSYLPAETTAETLIEKLSENEFVSKKHWNPFAKNLTQGVLESEKTLDEHIDKTLQNWRLERLSKVDLTILRLALYEMQTFPDIPVRVTLNEYIEIAKEFGTDDSAAFVNGILDRLAKNFPEKDFQKNN